MSHPQPSDGAADPLDPLGHWKAMRDRSMESWSKMMLDIVNSDAYARASAEWLDTCLTRSQIFQQALDQAMIQTLSQYKIPSTADITRLAERISNIEMSLDNLDARLDEVVTLLNGLAATATATERAVATAAAEQASEDKRAAARASKEAVRPVEPAAPTPSAERAAPAPEPVAEGKRTAQQAAEKIQPTVEQVVGKAPPTVEQVVGKAPPTVEQVVGKAPPTAERADGKAPPTAERADGRAQPTTERADGRAQPTTEPKVASAASPPKNKAPRSPNSPVDNKESIDVKSHERK